MSSPTPGSHSEIQVLHALGWYFPQSSGGTEVYVRSLARHLRPLGIHSSIMAAMPEGGDACDDVIDDVPVHRYRVGRATRREIASRRPHDGFDEFRFWLDAHRPDIYHQHSWTRGCGLPHLEHARAVGLPTVVTVHVPSVICLRGTMMRDGEEACDGIVDVAGCTRCWAPTRGIPHALAQRQAAWPQVSTALASALPVSRLRSALATPLLVEQRQQELAALAAAADRVVAVCHWLDAALLANGLPRGRVHCIAQGTESGDAPAKLHRGTTDTLHVGFIGRWDRVKGVDVLVDAVRRLAPSVRIALTIHGLPGDTAYEATVRRAAAGDARITFGPPLPRAEVAAALAGFDVLAVPSQWLETGPLVVLEAFAAGTPVVGSDLGGIRELVRDGHNGLLVDASDRDAWSGALARLAGGLAADLAGGVSAPRHSAAVAGDMDVIYRDLLAEYA